MLLNIAHVTLHIGSCRPLFSIPNVCTVSIGTKLRVWNGEEAGNVLVISIDLVVWNAFQLPDQLFNVWVLVAIALATAVDTERGRGLVVGSIGEVKR